MVFLFYSRRLACTYAHRMQTTKGHAPFEDVLRAAGIVIPLPSVRPLLQTKEREREEKKEKEAEKKVSSLRKSRPSINGNISATPKPRARGRTIDVVSASAPIASVPLPIPASASTPMAVSLSSKISQTGTSLPPERRQSSHRRRRSVRASTISVNTKILAAPGPIVQQNAKQSVFEREEREREKNVLVPVPTILTTKTPDGAARQSGDESTIPVTILAQKPSDATSRSDDPKWMEDRHRSLQKIKERKNARRGLSSVDERQATSASMSIHSRSLAPSASQTSTSQNRFHKGVERTKSRSRHGSGSGGGLGVSRSRSGKAIDAERAIQSDTGVMNMQREMSIRVRNTRADDDDIVLLGREMKMNKVNLSRDHLARQERALQEKEIVGAGTGTSVRVRAQDDAETVSDKTLVHQ